MILLRGVQDHHERRTPTDRILMHCRPRKYEIFCKRLNRNRTAMAPIEQMGSSPRPPATADIANWQCVLQLTMSRGRW